MAFLGQRDTVANDLKGLGIHAQIVEVVSNAARPSGMVISERW